MKIELSQEQMRSLPEPDENGLVRVSCGFRLDEQKGCLYLDEFNGSPFSDKKDDSYEPEETTEEMSRKVYSGES
jgi:hypothetical protein